MLSIPSLTFPSLATRFLPIVAVFSWLVLGASLAMQWGLDLVPCPMCIVQRYAIMALAVLATLAWATRKGSRPLTYAALLFAGFGAFTAARQSLLQWNPPEFMECGRDFYGMIEAFPLSKLIPAVFAGSGDCASSAENILGITLANASFVFFALAMALLAAHLWFSRQTKRL